MGDNSHLSSFRWVMLGLSFLGGLSLGLLWLSTVPFVLVVERDLNLTAAQVAFWVNIPITCGIFLCVPIGLGIDRWGAKRIGGLGVVLLALGGMGRGYAHSYEFLLMASAVFGIGYMTFFISLSKALATWFPSREIGMATGVLMAGTGMGSILGLSIVQPIFGSDWRDCFWVLGWLGIATAAAWWGFARDGVALEESRELPVRRRGIAGTFEAVLKTRMIWLLVAGFFCYIAGYTSWFTFGFPFLVRFRAMSEHSAALVLTVTMVGYTIAAIVMPVLSDRLGRRKPFFLWFAALAAASFIALMQTDTSSFVWIAAVLMGMSFGAINPLIFAVAAEARELGPALMGASMGTIISLGSIAGLLIPVVIGKFLGVLSIATERSFDNVWLVTAGWAGGIFVFGLLLRETGPGSQVSAR